MSPKSSILKAIPLFAGVSSGTLERYPFQHRSYESAAHLLFEGDDSSELFVLIQGTVGVFYSSEKGKNILVKIFGAPAVFGEMELFAPIPRLEYVKSLAPCEVAIFERDVALRMIKEVPSISFRLLEDVSKRLCIAAYHERALAFLDVSTRLANLLWDFLQAYPRTYPEGLAINYSLSQATLAGCLGVTERQIARVMGKWNKEGWLIRKKGRYVFIDPQALRAQTDPKHLALYTSLGRIEE